MDDRHIVVEEKKEQRKGNESVRNCVRLGGLELKDIPPKRFDFARPGLVKAKDQSQ